MRITTVRGHGYSYDLVNVQTQQNSIRAVIDLKPYHQRSDDADDTSPPSESTPSEPDVEDVPEEDDYDFNLNFLVPEDPQYDILQQLQDSSGPSDQSNESNSDSHDDTIYVTPTSSENDHSSIESDSLENLPESGNEIENTALGSDRNKTPSPTLAHTNNQGEPSPRPEYAYKLRLYQMGEREMDDLASRINLTISGTMTSKRTQIDEYFKINRPHYPRTDKGHLLFDCTFDPNKPRKIGDLSKLELHAVIKSYELPKPTLLTTDRKSLQKHVQKYFLKKYPQTKKADGEVLFGRSKEPSNKP